MSLPPSDASATMSSSNSNNNNNINNTSRDNSAAAMKHAGPRKEDACATCTKAAPMPKKRSSIFMVIDAVFRSRNSHHHHHSRAASWSEGGDKWATPKRWMAAVFNVLGLLFIATEVVRVMLISSGLLEIDISRTFELEQRGYFNETLSLLAFRNIQSAGVKHDMVGSGGGTWFSIDTSMGVHIAIHELDSHKHTLVTPHACSWGEEGSTDYMPGVLATRCNAHGDQACSEGCLTTLPEGQQLPTGAIKLAKRTVLVIGHTTEKNLQLKNSVGFGTITIQNRIDHMHVTQGHDEASQDDHDDHDASVHGHDDHDDDHDESPDLSMDSIDAQHLNDTYDHLEEGLVVGLRLHVMGDWINASWWQRTLMFSAFAAIMTNITVRLIAVPALVKGLRMGSNRLNVFADLVGGLFTSPGISGTMFFYFCVMNPHVWAVEDGALDFRGEFLEWFLPVISTTALVGFVLSMFSVGSTVKFYNSGSSLLIWSLIARTIDLLDSRTTLSRSFHNLGMILIRECTLFVDGETPVAELCSNEDSAGMSGLEIISKAYFRHFGDTMLLALAYECAARAFLCAFGNSRNSSAVTARPTSAPCMGGNAKSSNGASSYSTPSSSSLSSMGNRTCSSDSSRGAVDDPVFRVSSYETAFVLSGYRHSPFGYAWTQPIHTAFGTYFTVSHMIEDNHIMWGPLLLPLELVLLSLAMELVVGKERTVHALIRTKWYTAVQVTSLQLRSRRQNGSTIPQFVKNYRWDTGGIINPEVIG